MSENNSKSILNITSILCLLALGLFLRYRGLQMESNDMCAFLLVWYQDISQMGFKEALVTQVGDYSTVYQFLIFVMTRIPVDPMVAYKVLSIVFDVILSIGVYALTAAVSDRSKARLAMIVAFLFPTVWLNSAFWGQCDSIYTGIIIWALYFRYQEKNKTAFALIGLAFAFKLQTIFIIPFLGYLFIRDVWKRKKCFWKEAINYLMIPITFLGMAIPNIVAGRTWMEFLSIYINQTGTYTEMTLNYPGIWALFNVDYDTWKVPAILITFVILLAIMIWFLIKNNDEDESSFVYCALLMSYAAVLFLPAMHERYGFLYEILAIILVISTGRGYVKLFLMEVVTIRTYLYFLFNVENNMKALAIINILVFLVFVFDYWKAANHGQAPERRGASDQLMTGLLMVLLFTYIAMIPLNSMDSPQTSMTLSSDDIAENMIKADLYRVMELSEVDVYIGDEPAKARLFVADGNEWKAVEPELLLDQTNQLNKIECHEDTNCVALLFDKAEVYGVTVRDRYGKSLFIKNAEEYPQVFDERYCFTEYPGRFYEIWLRQCFGIMKE